MKRKAPMASAPKVLERPLIDAPAARRAARERAAARVAYGWVSVGFGAREIARGIIAWLRAAFC